MLRFASTLSCLGLLALAAAPLAAQQGEEADPEIRYISLTTFQAPPGPERQQAMEYIREVFVPMTRLDPNLLSFRIATHNWGSNGNQIVFLAEYPNWAAVEGDCEPCNDWYEEQQPEEGTPEREAWDEREAAFFNVYLGHSDELYTVNMDDYAKN